MIRFSRQAAELILNTARERVPLEACGYLGGRIDAGVTAIHLALELPNVDQSADHFSFAPSDQFAAVKALRHRGLRPVGNWHSHPLTPARPSDEDIRLAFDPGFLYGIATLQPGAGEPLRVWRIQDGEATEETIEFFDESAEGPLP